MHVKHKTVNAATGKYALHATKDVEALWNTSKTPRPFELSSLDVNTRDVSKNVVRAKDPQARLKASFRDVRVKAPA